MEKLLRFLESKQAVMLATIMSLTPQLWHSVEAFVSLEPGEAKSWFNYFFGMCFSISTSFAILLFTVRGKKWHALFFLAVELFINIIYYNVLGMESSALMWSTLFMCAIVPVNISFYSAEVKRDDPEKDSENESHDEGDGKESPFNWHKPENSFHRTMGPHHPADDRPSMQHEEPIGVDNKDFINEVNKIIGFDITDPNDQSGKVSKSQREELRKLWKKRRDLPKSKVIAEMKSIIEEGDPLFKNL